LEPDRCFRDAAELVADWPAVLVLDGEPGEDGADVADGEACEVTGGAAEEAPGDVADGEACELTGGEACDVTGGEVSRPFCAYFALSRRLISCTSEHVLWRQQM
jgi:hypothetical protein